MLSVGFYISKDCLCVAEVSLVRGKPLIHSVEQIFWSDKPEDKDKKQILAEEIQKISQKHKGQNLRFSYSIPQNLVSCFSVQFPFKERFKILKSLPFEIEDRTPFQLDKVFFDAQITRIKDKQAELLCYLSPKENLNFLRDFTKDLKKPIHLLSCSAASLSQLLQKWDVPLSQAQNPESSAVYIYLGDKSSCFFLYKEGFLNQVSTLNWSCLSFIQEMEKVYKITREKAWTEFFEKAFVLKETKGFTKEQVSFSNLAKKHIQPLVAELNLQKLSLETEQQSLLSKWVIFGPGAMIKNLSVFLSGELGVPVSKLPAFEPFPRWDWRQKALSAEAVGLALEGLKRKPYPGLNFLHFMKKDSLLLPKKLQKALLLALSLFLVFSAYAFVKKSETVKLLDRAQELFVEYGKKIAYLPQNQVNPPAVQKFLDNQQKRGQAEKKIQKELAVASPMLQLEKIIQKTGSAQNWNLRIDFLKISGKKVDIKASIDSSKLKAFESLLQSLSRQPLKNTLSDPVSQNPSPQPDKESTALESTNLDSTALESAVFSYSFELKDL